MKTKRQIKLVMQDNSETMTRRCAAKVFAELMTEALTNGATIISNPTVEPGHFVIAVHPDDYRAIDEKTTAADEAK